MFSALFSVHCFSLSQVTLTPNATLVLPPLAVLSLSRAEDRPTPATSPLPPPCPPLSDFHRHCWSPSPLQEESATDVSREKDVSTCSTRVGVLVCAVKLPESVCARACVSPSSRPPEVLHCLSRGPRAVTTDSEALPPVFAKRLLSSPTSSPAWHRRKWLSLEAGSQGPMWPRRSRTTRK